MARRRADQLTVHQVRGKRTAIKLTFSIVPVGTYALDQSRTRCGRCSTKRFLYKVARK